MALLDKIFEAAVEMRASDVHVVPGEPFMVRRVGQLVRLKSKELTAEQTSHAIAEILTPPQRDTLNRHQQLDFAYEVKGLGRFRGSAMVHNNGMSGIFRIIPAQIPTFKQLGIPAVVYKALDNHQGIILVTGATGHGKTTTLAAMVDYINERRAHHILSLEDPIEFIHPLKKAVVNQRQLGSSTLSYHNALKGALRQDPDVIVIGELRDLDTISMAISAAETGHLVIGTLSTSNAAKTVERIINSYPPGEQNQIRTMLSESLKMVLTQRLIAGKDRKQMVLAVEILVGNLSVANQIRDNKTYQIPSTMQMGKKQGMQLMDDSVFTLYEAGRISPEAAVINLESQVLRKRIIAAAKGS
ncbi:MAG: PilT/PilU family type 4a pilus ATPase [Desulfofustis sp. PB-SRB1]|jgi:twitching motility protein PilT|nr:PilT/PilU family type 4a pilus ATPase [Desulfofustis sp. PB-SRB1]MBM1002208.1 PilT/PilU family type 4a pilus ATPase [Desulfofustis sp. PB-SRB1]HBH28216.1 type IV pilus twitching motility protein PilT [Desulfofustis sp.]HBH32063.1 type IV pilus twitching motility protein PilT [Desulfofustis sp.]